jgi:Mrp family chromosome partitioning ATPase
MNLDLRQTSMKVSPAVYLASSEFTEKINEARDKNDYIIIDSSSLGNYSDAFLIARYADATVFIVKYGSTHKAMVKDILSDTRIPSPMIAINTVGK